MENHQSIGAYYQCHKNPFATFICLSSFRTYYPESTIVLISDNGYDYSEMAKLFHCIYIHDNMSARYIYKKTDVIEGHHIQNMYRLIERVRNAFLLVKEDYVMWLEDDVVIRNLIRDDLKYDLNGFCPNTFSQSTITKLKENYPYLEEREYRFSGHGGSIFQKKSLLESFGNETVIHDLLQRWLEYGFDELCQDVFFSLVLILNKKTVGPYVGHGDSCFENTNLIVQHQYKVFYGISMPDQLKHLVKIT
jgi:Zn-finger protein